MVEFSTNFSTRFRGASAVEQRALYRISVRTGEIPYFNGGISVDPYSRADSLNASIQRVLSDFNVNVFVSGDRVMLGDIVIGLPGGLS